MSRFFNRKSIAFVLVALVLLAGVLGAVAVRGNASHAAAPKAHPKAHTMAAGDKNSFCSALGHTIQASSGAQMACNGPQPNGNGAAGHNGKHKKNVFGSNVDAATPSEDITPNGTQAYGQSEESVAGTGPYVVEGWNDATGFFAPPCSASFKDQLTGFGFSSNGGKTFVDEGGLPNVNCGASGGFSKWAGDPSIEVWSPGGITYFYAASLIEGGDCFFLCVAVTAGKVTGSTISFNATPTELIDFPGGFNIEDKDFLSIDPVRGILYVSFTDFAANFNGQITLWACDIGTDPGNPVCNGPLAVAASTGCNELEGAYPAVDLGTGDVYVAYEDNWATNIFGCNLPVKNDINQVGSPCTLPVATFPNAGCAAVNTFSLASVNIDSLDAAFIPGYNRFPANDFPRIAVSDPAGTVSIVWNDVRNHPLGDILLQSFDLNGLFPTPVQSVPTQINPSTGGLHFLPALRNVDDDGDLQISWYQRASANTALTDVFAAIDVSPLATAKPGNVKVTTGSSDWNAVSSDIIPNFGDYTDNYVNAMPSPPFTGQTLSVAWADGRLGLPNPFYASAHTT